MLPMILEIQELMRRGCRRCIGNGLTTKIGTDPWLPTDENPFVTTPLHGTIYEAHVSSLFNPHGTGWDEECVHGIFNERDANIILNIPVCMRKPSDAWVWYKEAKGDYTVKSGYRMLVSEIKKMSSVFNNDNDKVVGFKKEAETIVDRLIHGPKEREIVLITGMGGLGKTTLARRVYDEKFVARHFDIRAWCTISQEYHCKDLLSTIYSQIVRDSKIQIEDVAEKLRKSLMGMRYLIVLDDIWSVEAWEELNRAFPSCDNGSRIVLTSRQVDVVSDAIPIPLPFFTSNESWQLLHMKLFKGKRCSKEFETIGTEISKKCRGLPLVVSLVAGLLEGIEKNEQTWCEFLNNLKSQEAFRDGILSNDAIELSYKHLSHHLKPCLLYFAAFQGNKVVKASKLVELWISEGFIDIREKVRVEEEAEGCLNELIRSNLIMVFETEYDGHILSCVVHDLVRDFCLTKAKEENFLQIINLKNELDHPSMIFTPHRICFSGLGGKTFPYESVPWNSSISTLLVSDIGSSSFGPEIYNVTWIAKNFEHLTILDLEFIDVDKSFLSDVNSSLVHLRYLALSLCGCGSISPLSLENLQCLITLKLMSLDEDLRLPNFFWNLRSLRHMIIHHSDCDSCPAEPTTTSDIETVHWSEDLQILSLLAKICKEDEHILRKFPHLKVLTCLISPSYPFAEIEFFHHLEYLELRSDGYSHLLNDLKLSRFPTSIKEVVLFGITLSSPAISVIAQLSNLEALTLDFCKFEEGLKWNVEEEIQFCKLKYLKLDNLDISAWNISSAEESFPCLELLILEGCSSLEEVPSNLADILTLELISVRYCYNGAVSSAKRIQEDARDIGNEQLYVDAV
nr:putative late blight resistance protein homolog R1B-16 [Ipomoea batatas]